MQKNAGDGTAEIPMKKTAAAALFYSEPERHNSRLPGSLLQNTESKHLQDGWFNTPIAMCMYTIYIYMLYKFI